MAYNLARVSCPRATWLVLFTAVLAACSDLPPPLTTQTSQAMYEDGTGQEPGPAVRVEPEVPETNAGSPTVASRQRSEPQNDSPDRLVRALAQSDDLIAYRIRTRRGSVVQTEEFGDTRLLEPFALEAWERLHPDAAGTRYVGAGVYAPSASETYHYSYMAEWPTAARGVDPNLRSSNGNDAARTPSERGVIVEPSLLAAIGSGSVEPDEEIELMVSFYDGLGSLELGLRSMTGILADDLPLQDLPQVRRAVIDAHKTAVAEFHASIRHQLERVGVIASAATGLRTDLGVLIPARRVHELAALPFVRHVRSAMHFEEAVSVPPPPLDGAGEPYWAYVPSNADGDDGAVVLHATGMAHFNAAGFHGRGQTVGLIEERIHTYHQLFRAVDGLPFLNVSRLFTGPAPVGCHRSGIFPWFDFDCRPCGATLDNPICEGDLDTDVRWHGTAVASAIASDGVADAAVDGVLPGAFVVPIAQDATERGADRILVGSVALDHWPQLMGYTGVAPRANIAFAGAGISGGLFIESLNIAAAEHLIEQDVDVINFSRSGVFLGSLNRCRGDADDSGIYGAVHDAMNAGILWVNAAGNTALEGGDCTVEAPADGPFAFTVGQLRGLGTSDRLTTPYRAYDSSFGPAARSRPGLVDAVAVSRNDRQADVLSDDAVRPTLGTSFSSPVVAGSAAVLREYMADRGIAVGLDPRLVWTSFLAMARELPPVTPADFGSTPSAADLDEYNGAGSFYVDLADASSDPIQHGVMPETVNYPYLLDTRFASVAQGDTLRFAAFPGLRTPGVDDVEPFSMETARLTTTVYWKEPNIARGLITTTTSPRVDVQIRERSTGNSGGLPVHSSCPDVSTASMVRRFPTRNDWQGRAVLNADEIVGRCLTMEVTGADIPRGSRRTAVLTRRYEGTPKPGWLVVVDGRPPGEPPLMAVVEGPIGIAMPEFSSETFHIAPGTMTAPRAFRTWRGEFVHRVAGFPRFARSQWRVRVVDPARPWDNLIDQNLTLQPGQPVTAVVLGEGREVTLLAEGPKGLGWYPASPGHVTVHTINGVVATDGTDDTAVVFRRTLDVVNRGVAYGVDQGPFEEALGTQWSDVEWVASRGIDSGGSFSPLVWSCVRECPSGGYCGIRPPTQLCPLDFDILARTNVSLRDRRNYLMIAAANRSLTATALWVFEPWPWNPGLGHQARLRVHVGSSRLSGSSYTALVNGAAPGDGWFTMPTGPHEFSMEFRGNTIHSAAFALSGGLAHSFLVYVSQRPGSDAPSNVRVVSEHLIEEFPVGWERPFRLWNTTDDTTVRIRAADGAVASALVAPHRVGAWVADPWRLNRELVVLGADGTELLRTSLETVHPTSLYRTYILYRDETNQLRIDVIRQFRESAP